MNPSGPALVLLADTPKQRRLEAQRLAARLERALLSHLPDHSGPALLFTPERVELRNLGARSGPVYCDFVHGPNAHRQRYGGGRGQALARACGVIPGTTPTITDATAGLGRDAWALATLGCALQAIEHDPYVHALLQDGLRRALAHPATRDIAARIQLHHADALRRLPQAPQFDTVYLDPMFPAREKAAAVKKGMAMLQRLTHTATDEAALLAAARTCGATRIAVKRPAKAQPLAGVPPHASIPGKTVRYDLYRPTAQVNP